MALPYCLSVVVLLAMTDGRNHKPMPASDASIMRDYFDDGTRSTVASHLDVVPALEVPSGARLHKWFVLRILERYSRGTGCRLTLVKVA